jgi:hypothetical protein
MPTGLNQDIMVGMGGDVHHAWGLERNALIAA